MVYADDPCVPIWKCLATIDSIFVGQDHDVSVRMGIGGLFYPACIVCRGPEPNGLVMIYSVVINYNTVVFKG